jgi:hypothetical protein
MFLLSDTFDEPLNQACWAHGEFERYLSCRSGYVIFCCACLLFMFRLCEKSGQGTADFLLELHEN